MCIFCAVYNVYSVLKSVLIFLSLNKNGRNEGQWKRFKLAFIMSGMSVYIYYACYDGCDDVVAVAVHFSWSLAAKQCNNNSSF